MTEKTPNYTEAQTEALVEAYSAAETQEARTEVIRNQAAMLNKSVASVRAKLVREKVYVKNEYQTKQGDTPVSKAKLVDRIAAAMNVDAEIVESLEKATKTTLKAVLVAVTPAETNESE